MYNIKRIASGCFAVILASYLLTGCSLHTKEVPESTTQTMPTVTAEIPTQTTTIEETSSEIKVSASSTEINAEISPITEFLKQQDTSFTTIIDYIKTSDNTYLTLYSTDKEATDNTYQLVLANPDNNTYEVILNDTPLVYLQSIEDKNSFTIVKLYQKSEDNANFISIAPQLSHFYRSDSIFAEEIIPYTIDKNDPLFETYFFGNDNFDSAMITDLILEDSRLRIRQQINTTSFEALPVLTHISYNIEENKFTLSMECHDSVEILPQPEESSLIKTIFLSAAEEGSTLEISPSSSWNGQYYIQEEIISRDDTSYIIDTLFSLSPYTPLKEKTEAGTDITS